LAEGVLGGEQGAQRIAVVARGVGLRVFAHTFRVSGVGRRREAGNTRSA
jgi:hypothetical protein